MFFALINKSHLEEIILMFYLSSMNEWYLKNNINIFWYLWYLISFVPDKQKPRKIKNANILYLKQIKAT